MSGNIFWCDVETTGLDPTKDLILEVAFTITSPDLERDLFRGSWVVPRTEEELSRCSDFVLKMHTENSLLEECLGAKPPSFDGAGSVADIAEIGLAAARDYGAIDCEWQGARYRSPIAGSTPTFDRGFLRAYMPTLESQFSHRHIDVSTILECVRRWYKDLPRESYSIHRAAPDVARSIGLAKSLRSKYFRPYNTTLEGS